MKLPLLFLIQILKLVSSTEIVDKTENVLRIDFSAYNGFPIAVLCDHFDFLYDHNSQKGFEEFDSDETQEEGFEESDESDETEGDDYDYPIYPDESDEVQCVITRNGATLFNETFIWEDAPSKGIFDTTDETWNEQEISVLVKWDDGPEEGQLFVLTVNVTDSNEYNCANVIRETYTELKEPGEELDIYCFAPHGMYMNESQFNSITTVWYHNCEKIERDNGDFTYGEVEYKFDGIEDIEFDLLKIRNTSLSTTPGKYHCALKIDNLELPSASYEVCLKEKFKENLPTIVVGKEKYEAIPGSTLNVTCSGHTGMESESLSQDVRWYKYEKVNGTLIKNLKCFDMLSSLSTDGNCSSVLHKNKKYCSPLSTEEIANAANDKLGDAFVATYILRDVSEADSGTYACELVTTARDKPGVNFTVIVELGLEEPTNALTIALSVVAGCIILAIVLFLLFYLYMTPILYFLKHHFGPYETTEDKQYVTYLVYTPRVFDVENNMLEDTNEYFEQMRHLVYDLNRDPNHAGARVADHIIEILRRCMTVVLLVTPDLLELAKQFTPDSNENYCNEILGVYQALKNNVENLKLRLVFICAKNTKKEIYSQARRGNNFCVMLRRFMGRQGNSVILWKPNNHSSFRRALYVAMPKLNKKENLQT